MTEVDAGQLREAIETQHGGTATLAQSVPVLETFEDQIAELRPPPAAAST